MVRPLSASLGSKAPIDFGVHKSQLTLYYPGFPEVFTTELAATPLNLGVGNLLPIPQLAGRQHDRAFCERGALAAGKAVILGLGAEDAWFVFRSTADTFLKAYAALSRVAVAK